MIGPDVPDYSFMQHILQEAIHYFYQRNYSFQHYLDLRMYLDGGASGNICRLSPILKTRTVCWLHVVELLFAESEFASTPAHDSASFSSCVPIFLVIVAYSLDSPRVLCDSCEPFSAIPVNRCIIKSCIMSICIIMWVNLSQTMSTVNLRM
jgi:hypothetical protein